MNTTNHTIGEDAANGAMGEREAFEAWARTDEGNCADYDLARKTAPWTDEYRNDLVQRDWEVWQARAALTAEKVVGQEPLAGSPAFALRGLYKPAMEYFLDGKSVTADEYIAWQRGIIEAVTKAKLPDPKYYGGSAEEGEQHEVKCAYVDGWNDCRGSIIAAPQQPAQSADHDERAAEYRVGWFKSSSNPRNRVRCLFEGTEIAEAEKHHSFIEWCDAPAASTQSSATQPVQAERALPVAGETWYAKIRDASTLSTFEVIEVSAGTVLVTSPGSHYQNRFEISDLKFIERLLAAQPASGGEA